MVLAKIALRDPAGNPWGPSYLLVMQDMAMGHGNFECTDSNCSPEAGLAEAHL